mmetsp:Transcript_21479/g.46558  ORF Transcript_21479/g.46558 Transcript_21479/m.46558 type:complete len:82 (-) Transcript_21479:555-800(-)
MRGLPEGSPPHQQDVMGLLCASWEKVTAEAIMNCWHKAQLRINQKAATVKAEGKSLVSYKAVDIRFFSLSYICCTSTHLVS